MELIRRRDAGRTPTWWDVGRRDGARGLREFREGAGFSHVKLTQSQKWQMEVDPGFICFQKTIRGSMVLSGNMYLLKNLTDVIDA